MTQTITTELPATDRWTPPRDGVLRDLFLCDICVAELPGDRWTRELVMTDGRPQGHNVFPTRAAAIRASVAIAIREARTKHRTPRDLYDTNPAFGMNAEQLRVYVGWLRGIVAVEATRKMAAIEKYERGCRRATDWIADREIELGVAGMHPSADGYPKQLAAAWAKYNEFQAALAILKAPIAALADPTRTSRRLEHYQARLQGCIEPIPTATGNLLDHYLSSRDRLQSIVDEELGFLSGPPVPPPVELRFKPSKKDDGIEIVVGEVAPGIWCEGTSISIDNSGYGGPGWSFGKRFATEAEAWNEAIGDLAKNLRDRPRQAESVKKAQAWLEGVAAERGVDIDAQLERSRLELLATLARYRAAKESEEAEDADPFRAHLGRDLGAGIEIRPAPSGCWTVRHDCSWGARGYSRPHGDLFPTRQAAFDYAFDAIGKEARSVLDSDYDRRIKLGISSRDAQRANKILCWLNGLAPPGQGAGGMFEAVAA